MSVNNLHDYDFIGFTYNGKHSIKDLKIYRVNTGDRFSQNLSPNIKNITSPNTNGDGEYLLNAFYTNRPFTIDFAFNELFEDDLINLVRVFS